MLFQNKTEGNRRVVGRMVPLVSNGDSARLFIPLAFWANGTLRDSARLE